MRVPNLRVPVSSTPSKTSSRALQVGGVVAGVLVALGLPRDAAADSLSVNATPPNVLLLIDTSGSMAWRLSDNNNASYVQGVGDKARFAIIAETLTGSINDLFVKTVDPGTGNIFMYGSGNTSDYKQVCRPAKNTDATITGALATNKYAWPVGSTANQEQPVGFNKNLGAGGWCKYKGGSTHWDQNDDGLIDDYKDRIRFAVAGFDNSAAITKPISATDESYWFYSATDWWLTPAAPMHMSYTDGISGGEATNDKGMVNSRTDPAKGRLIGFGPADWSTTIAGGYCSTVSDCMLKHNDMVQLDVLAAGSNLTGGTPLAAMMRDASEFLLTDTLSEGVYVPHPAATNPNGVAALMGKIGLQKDQGWIDGCRDTAVILLTDGEPSSDLSVRMAKYTQKIYTSSNPPIKVYVVGVGLDHAKWGPTNGGPILEDKACADLREADLDMDGSKAGAQMCEWSTASSKWKYADVVVASGAEKSNIRACCTLLEAAVAGGTGQAYFPNNAAELKQNINGVLLTLGGGSISRTTPVFGTSTTAALGQLGSSNAPAVSYELRTSLAFDDKDKMWRGKVERVRYACDASDKPEIKTVDATKGDQFDANMDDLASTFPRKFFTVVPKHDKELGGTLRIKNHPSLGKKVNDLDTLFRGGEEGDYRRQGGDDTAGEDELVELSNWKSAIDGAVSGGKADAPDVLAVNGGDCGTYTGDSNKDVCADRILKWYGGANTPGGTTISRHAGSTACPAGRTCSPLGGIYHTTPVIVPPPQPFDSDDQNFGKNRTDSLVTSFYDKLGKRPTMVYSQTTDGLLHAFVMNKNDFTPGSTFSDDVPTVDTLDNNELWSFVPPAVTGEIFKNFDKSTILLDGQLAWGNVVYERPYGNDGTTSAAEVANWDYKTVIVGASGRASKSFYYALDVSDPLKPRFLWQLSTAGNKKDDGDGNDDDDGDGDDDKGDPGASLFGASVPGAAITHIRYREPSDGSEHIYAVAVLPGGTSDKTPGGPVDRRRDIASEDYWIPTDREPRKKIRDWGNDVEARSLTIVELNTGRILGRLVGDWTDNPADKDGGKGKNKGQLLNAVTVDPDRVLFDSPISGIPVAYPAGVGAVADRIYVGDQDGTMWRVEINDPDPQKWRAFIAFDAYNNDGTLADAWVNTDGTPAKLALSVTDDQAAVMGQPITTAPTLSLDDNNNVVLSFATGDQEDFNKEVTGMVNMTLSVTDKFITNNGAGMPPYQVTVDANSGIELAFKDGARVTGPLNLFDGQLFFSYYIPGAASACTEGTGGICGFDYLRKEADGSPTALMDFGGSTAVDECFNFSNGEVVFGIAVTQVPSCVDDSVPGFDDPWLSGKYSSMTQSSTGGYQLSYQTGQAGTASNGATTNTSTRALPTPRSRTKVRTWVSLIE